VAAILEVLGLVLMLRQGAELILLLWQVVELLLWQGAELILLLWQVVELLWFFVLRLLRLLGRPQDLGETQEIHFQNKEARFYRCVCKDYI
jgi:hypothetical protein